MLLGTDKYDKRTMCKLCTSAMAPGWPSGYPVAYKVAYDLYCLFTGN